MSTLVRKSRGMSSPLPFFRDDAAEMPPGTATWILSNLGLPAQTKGRLALLREKNSEDEITADERQELHDYLDAVSMIELLKATAKAALKHHQP